MKIAIVIPVYNEEVHIAKVLEEISKRKLPIIVVDDGSEDKTTDILTRLRKQDKKITILNHRVNIGKGAAMKTGARAAFDTGAEAVIFMDADGQHLASDLSKFIKRLEKSKCEVIFGSRNLGFSVPLVRFLGNKLASVFVALFFGIYISDLICGYRAITKRAFRKLNWESTGYGVETEMVIKVGKYGLKHCEVPVETVYLDGVKGVTMLDAANILIDVFRWRLNL